MLGKLGKRAQTTAEYAILIAVVVGAVVAMQVYIRRGIQGRIRDVMVDTGLSNNEANVTDPFTGAQYEPYYLISNATTAQTSDATENVAKGGSVTRILNAETTVNRMQKMGWGTSTNEEQSW